MGENKVLKKETSRVEEGIVQESDTLRLTKIKKRHLSTSVYF